MVLAQASTSTSLEGTLKHMFCPGRVAATLCTAEGFGGLAPYVLALMLCFVLNSSQIPSEPLVSLPLYGPQLPGLRFQWHPQPYLLRKCVGDFRIVSSLLFASPSKMECH
jgi:hypothetical protein